MGDCSKFCNGIVYWLFNFSLFILILSELVLFVTTKVRGYKRENRASDHGSMLMIIIGFWVCIFLATFFRSMRFTSTIGTLLLPDVFSYLGIICIILGMVIRWIAIITLNRAFTFNVQTSKSQHLITTGLYKKVRNPAYSGSILSLLGVAIAYRNVISIIAVFIVSILTYSYRIHIEENELQNAFQDEFSNYCKVSKRLIPYIW